jgi:hypothetical protein
MLKLTRSGKQGTQGELALHGPSYSEALFPSCHKYAGTFVAQQQTSDHFVKNKHL